MAKQAAKKTETETGQHAFAAMANLKTQLNENIKKTASSTKAVKKPAKVIIQQIKKVAAKSGKKK